MTGQAGLLELSAGSALLLGGREWTVASVEAQYGRVLLRAGGEERRRSIRWLAHHPARRPVPDDDAAVLARRARCPGGGRTAGRRAPAGRRDRGPRRGSAAPGARGAPPGL